MVFSFLECSKCSIFQISQFHFFNFYIYAPAVKPKSLTVKTVNASSVRVTWSNNPCVPTSLMYTSHFTATGSAVSGHQLVFPPQQASAVVSVSERLGHLHNFTIQYILSEGMMGTAVSIIFSFGNREE